MKNNIEKLHFFEKFKIDVTELCPPVDNNLFISLFSLVNENKFPLAELVRRSQVSLSTYQRIFQNKKIKHREIRNILISELQYAVDIPDFEIADLNLNLQYYFSCDYYIYIEEAKKYFDKLISKREIFKNTPIDQLISIIGLHHYGFNKDKVGMIRDVLIPIREYYPLWIQKLIDWLLCKCYALEGETEKVYKCISDIEEKEDKDIWDKYLEFKNLGLARLLNDQILEAHQLLNDQNIEDVTDYVKTIKLKLGMTRLLLLQGNYHESRELINQVKALNMETKSEEIDNTCIQYIGYIYFMEGNYKMVIQIFNQMKEIGTEFYTSYYFLLYAYVKMYRMDEFDDLMQYVHKLGANFPKLSAANLLFEQLMTKQNFYKIREDYKIYKDYVKQEYRLGNIVLINMLKDRTIIK